jgi:hypothetical protein
MDVEEVPTGGEQQPRAPTTTISTISVHSGDTRLVIALLQVSCSETELLYRHIVSSSLFAATLCLYAS